MPGHEFFPQVSQVLDKIRTQKKATISGLTGSALSLFACELSEKTAPVIIIAPDAEIERYFGEIRDLTDRVLCIDEKNAYLADARIVITARQFLDRRMKIMDKVVLEKEHAADIGDLLARLAETGYSREDIVEEEGEYALRGGILDVFEPSRFPARVEFYGDSINSIRQFDVLTQRSTAQLEKLELSLAIRDIADSILHFAGENAVYIDLEGHDPALRGIEIKPHGEFDFRLAPPRKYFGDLKALKDDVARGGFGYKFIVSKPALADRLRSVLGEVDVIALPLREGFVDEETATVYLTETEVIGELRRKREKFRGLFVDDLKGLKEDDFVVHNDFGIGQFKGLALMEFDGRNVECLRIDYAGSDRIYLPVEKLNLLERFVASDDRPPRLSKIGSELWVRAKQRVRKAAEKLAIDLANLYGKRSAAQGHAFSRDANEMAELEAMFPYEETRDQLKAIHEVKRDMESSRPQERLICGDVGYGKTEIALRAAFKAALDGKQTMFLCPTTLLAFQHYNTFRKRLAQFPIRVEMVSRFRSRSELPGIFGDIRNGSIDIAIGTHRLLQPDVRFKDLGLLIIDEEQRFGVIQKERIKQLKPNIDVLYLSATPIPRTLYMALTGIKDISNIYTPPPGRKDITTRIVYWDDEEIRKIIEHEQNRGGQVFFVHNRIQTIDTISARLRGIMPGLSLCVLHGKVRTDISEKKMMEFIEGKYDLLLSTAIIESGLDMPRVNTIIVNEAHKFGLADLHQLRGRIGRADIQGHAYFIIPERKITDEANKRLSALVSYTSLGSGFRLALRDMEIRGIGNLLGREQSGYINSIGYHHYTKILAQVVNDLKGIKAVQEPVLSLNLQAYFPVEYISNPYERTALYKRLLDAESDFEIESIKAEITDRFGRYPEPVENLFLLSRIRLRAIELGASEVTRRVDRVIFYRDGNPVEETRIHLS
jgi:transcription-repair coupling factor (superfamily II helicase)